MTGLLHALRQSRTIPAVGDLAGLPAVVLGLLSEGTWQRELGIAGAIILVLSRVAKLVVDLNGLGNAMRGHNVEQDEQLEDHERRLRALEGARSSRRTTPSRRRAVKRAA